MNNKYILINAEDLIEQLKSIIDYCDEHMYKNTVSEAMVKKLPYMDKPTITFHLYRRDGDDELNCMMKRACDACAGAVAHVLKEGTDGKMEVTGGVTVKCTLMQHRDDESLMESIPAEWLRPVGLGRRIGY